MINKKNVSFCTVEFMLRTCEHLRPKPPMTISEWAEANMIFPDGSAEAGHYSCDTVPYQKEIMDAITDVEVTNVSVMSSAQVGKTTILMCGVGYYIDYEPSTQMIVLPTMLIAGDFSKTRLAKMLADVPVLNEKVADAKAKDSNNTIYNKIYPGGDVIITGANSPAKLRSHPRRILWMDEIDAYPDSVGGEGDPIELAEKRTTTYWNKKHIKTSTPTIKGHSKIETSFQDGTMEEWCVRCPECGEWQPYDFDRVDFESVRMACKECGILSGEVAWRESEHKWIAKHPERKKHRSFHLNELASPFVEWSDIIKQFQDAYERMKKYHDPSKMIVFKNTVLGETWDETDSTEEGLNDHELMKRAENYGADIPEGVLLLTAAVDVQDDRFELEVRGWGREYESWGIYKTEIYGNLITAEPWEELEATLNQDFSFADGRTLSVAAFAIDEGGHYTNSVRKWGKKMKENGKKCYIIKGHAKKDDDPLIMGKRTVDIKEERNGKKIVVDHTILHNIGVNSGKEDIMHRLAITEPGPGYCHFPIHPEAGYDNKYYVGLTCEKMVRKVVNGNLKKAWVKPSGARNEPFDLFNYNLAAMEILRPDFDSLERKLNEGINYVKPTGAKNKFRRKLSGGLQV